MCACVCGIVVLICETLLSSCRPHYVHMKVRCVQHHTCIYYMSAHMSLRGRTNDTNLKKRDLDEETFTYTRLTRTHALYSPIERPHPFAVCPPWTAKRARMCSNWLWHRYVVAVGSVFSTYSHTRCITFYSGYTRSHLRCLICIIQEYNAFSKILSNRLFLWNSISLARTHIPTYRVDVRNNLTQLSEFVSKKKYTSHTFTQTHTHNCELCN